MSSSSYLKESSRKKELDLSLGKRILLVFLACCIQAIYIPTSNQVTGGIEPRLSIDVYPIWPVWVLPYVLCYILWLAGMVWAVLKMEDRLFQAFIAACMFTFALGAGTFIFFPTYVGAATIEGQDVFASLLRFIHQNWGRYDALPSGHVYITTLMALFFSRWYPSRKFFWILTVVIVSLSTLFTAQHYLLDVLGGYVAALAGYHFGLWWAGLSPAPKRMNKRSGKRIASSSLN